ncbi:MAG: hypothetical protein ACKOLA_07330 [Spartobacteria bacterium]
MPSHLGHADLGDHPPVIQPTGKSGPKYNASGAPVHGSPIGARMGEP